MTSAYPLGKTDWAEGQIRATWGVIGTSGAPSGFAEIRLAEVLHPQIFQESLNLKDKIGPYRKGRELRKWGGTSLRSDRPGQWFPLVAPDGTEVFPIRNDGKEGHWRWGKKNVKMVTVASLQSCLLSCFSFFTVSAPM
jgi:hypothetical protein